MLARPSALVDTRVIKASDRSNVPAELRGALYDGARISGAPHDFYRYPARFSPRFVRAAIQAFTQPGDLVIDPFCGGGTAVVEAVALGRRAIGADVSSLATFLTRAKTTPLSVHDGREILAWLDALRSENLNGRLSVPTELSRLQTRNLPPEPRRFLQWTIDRIARLPTCRQRRFARLMLLAVAQRAIDCREKEKTRVQLRNEFCLRLSAAVTDFAVFNREAARLNDIPQGQLTSLRRILCCSSETLDHDRRIPPSWLPAKLVLTSPPYPGVHIVYHRWQINGRKETPTPFWLANQRDGAGESHYLLGPRDQSALSTYYGRLRVAFSSVAKLLDQQSIVLQLVSFSDPTWQLDAYLRAMVDAGFKELSKGRSENRLWRKVPSRKWYAANRGNIPPSNEVLLLHTLA